MDKIFKFSLGVLCLMNSIACYAIERFEVLPDLPDPLVQPVVASTVSGSADTTSLLGGQSIGHEPNIISVLVSLAIVILLIYVTGILYTKLNKAGFNAMKRQQGDFAKSQVSVVSTTQLGGNKTLHVVELDGKRMLIGASASTIQLIKDLGSTDLSDDDGEYSKIEIPNIKIPKIEIPKIEIPSINFSKLVTKAHKGLKDIDAVITEEKEVEEELVQEQVIKENIYDEQNSEGIIDSLFVQQDNDEVMEEEPVKSEHTVDPDDFALYKKYLS
jgi:flagellar biogenesis protein FliO